MRRDSRRDEVTFTLTDASKGTDVLTLQDNFPQNVSPADGEACGREALDKLGAFVEACQSKQVLASLECGDA